MKLRLSVIIVAPFTLAACQRYAPAPLDLEGYRASLHARDVTGAGVRDYARRLAEGGTGPAGPYDPTDGLSLDEAEVVALFFNPQLRLARLDAAVRRLGAAEAGRWEDP